ncbi:O-antigen ligase family protein [Bosea sp. BH3]|uniref:O-antigen ligase family protein n=1 Tax=Bosea sp. BH3 TaxID=2871701 RepID=UPI0021CB5B65|nr:O-antigen ligase [Bosea sp. BH3]MCU4180200.1 O-antigen ligase family protein [Bosea sp. BH3]
MSQTAQGQIAGVGASLRTGEASASLGTVLAGFALFILILSLQPFAGVPDAAGPDGSTSNLINQIGYLALGLLFGAALLRLTPPSVLAEIGLGGWAVVFGVAAISTVQALDMAGSIRGLMLTAVAMIIVVGALILPRDEPSFAEGAVNASLAVLALVYGALIFAPHLAVHSSEGSEGVHAGDWLGHLSHKNVAAPVFSIVAMLGIYAWRGGLKWRGAIVIALCIVFVVNSGSKTTMGFLPLSVGLVMFARWTGRPGLSVLIHFGLVAAVAALTLGAAASPRLYAITSALISDPTFTGRDDIWKFSFQRIAERPWAGYGFVGFWGTANPTSLEQNLEAVWDVRAIGSGHQSYLDAALAFGIPGAVIVTYQLMVRPLLSYVASWRIPGNGHLADLFATIVIFMTYIGMLESFILNRADPLWLLFALGVVGLHLAGRVRAKHV